MILAGNNRFNRFFKVSKDVNEIHKIGGAITGIKIIRKDVIFRFCFLLSYLILEIQ